MNFDAIIVGAGPVGSTVASAIAREGYDVLILEEHPQVGLPQHCTGKISVRASKELELPRIGILQEVRGATFYSPNINFVSVERKAVQAHIFERVILDKWLSEKAVDCGVTLFTSARAIDVSMNSNGVNVVFKHKGKHQQLTARVVIGADGADSLITRLLGLNSKEKSEVKVAVQREMTNLRDVKSGFVELYLGEKYAPGFFAWIVPIGKNSAYVGLGVKHSQTKHLVNYLERFIASHPVARKKLEGGLCARQTVHIIPTGGAIHQTVADGALVVGDAAGQVKSTTGGGLYYGMVSAKIAGHVVSKALSSKGNILRKGDLMEYQNLWQDRLGKEIKMSVKMRQLLDSLSDKELDYLIRVVREDEALISLIETEGDIDWQSKISAPALKHLLGALIKKPQLLLKMGKFLF